MHFLTHFFADLFNRGAERRTHVVPIDDVSPAGLWPGMIDQKDDEDGEDAVLECVSL